ncbi:MAG: hypothetical protein M3P92_01305, partial [Actinomycetota bacterium]|nr:hypothetical protein [Actinomycetota bacterium]
MTILNESGIPDVLPPLHAVSNLARRLGDTLLVVVGTQAEAHLVQSLPAEPSPNLPPSGHDPRVVFAILDPEDPPSQGSLASRIVEGAAGMRNVNLVLLVAARPRLGVDAAFEARLASRKLDLPVEAVDPEAPHDIPGTLSTDLDDSVVSALVDLCPRRRTSDLVETAATKRGSLLGGLLGRGRETPEPGDGRPVVLLGGTGREGAAQELAAELARA